MSQEYKRLSEEQTPITQERRSQEARNVNTSPGGGSLGASQESREASSPRGRHGNNTSSMEILPTQQEGGVVESQEGADGGKVEAKGGPGRFRRFLTRFMTSYPPYDEIIHVRKSEPVEVVSPNPVPEPEVFPHTGRTRSKNSDQSDEPGLRPTWSYMKRQASSHGILVATLLMINAAQLKTLILMDDVMRDAFWMGSLVLVAVSLTLLTCLTVLVTLTVLHRVHTPQHQVVSTHLNDVTVVISVLVIVCNILTTVFGLTNL